MNNRCARLGKMKLKIDEWEIRIFLKITLILGLGEVQGEQLFQHVRKMDTENFREENHRSRRMEVRKTKSLDRKTKGNKNTQFIPLILWLPLACFFAFTFRIFFSSGIICYY